jgi:hypothetical protein
MAPARRRIPVRERTTGRAPEDNPAPLSHRACWKRPVSGSAGSAREFLAQEFGPNRKRRGCGFRAFGVGDDRVPDRCVPGRLRVGDEDLLSQALLQIGEPAAVCEDALVGEGGEQAPADRLYLLSCAGRWPPRLGRRPLWRRRAAGAARRPGRRLRPRTAPSRWRWCLARDRALCRRRIAGSRRRRRRRRCPPDWRSAGRRRRSGCCGRRRASFRSAARGTGRPGQAARTAGQGFYPSRHGRHRPVSREVALGSIFARIGPWVTG